MILGMSTGAYTLVHVAISLIAIGSGLTYYLGRESFLQTSAGKMGPFTEGIFAFMSRNAQPATKFFNIPPDRVMEVGMHIDL